MANYNSFDLFIIRNQNQLNKNDWDDISEKYELNIDMMRLFQNKLNWAKIAQYQLLSIDFINEFIQFQLKDYLDIICKHQELSESFIHEHKENIDWELVLKHQNLSAEFIVDHASDIQFYKEKMYYDEVDSVGL